MTEKVQNMRIRFYGTQGSGSVFPDKRERHAQRELMDFELLKGVFEDLQARSDGSGRIDCGVEDILGGPVTRKNLMAYRRRFQTPEVRSYGGWTTCVWVETADGDDIVLDCGSGFRNCAKDLQEKWSDRPDRTLHIFGSHSHLDHTEGFDQAAVCFDPRNTLRIHGNRQFLKALDSNLGIFTRHVEDDVRGVQTPLFFGLMPTRFEACEIRDLEAGPPSRDDRLAHFHHHVQERIHLGETSITPFEVFHPAPCLAYRIERGGKIFVFCTDHELRRGPDPDDPKQKASLKAERRLIEHAAGVDVLYRDGQYLQPEYEGLQGIGASGAVPRLDWGHSCIEDIQEMARECAVKQTFIGHHDPNRDWSERNWIDEALRREGVRTGVRIELARAETIVDL